MSSDLHFTSSTTSEDVAHVFQDQIANSTVLITGVSPNGLGESMAYALAKMKPAKLILTARTISKAQEVARGVQGSGNPSIIVETIEMDLSSMASVRAAAAHVIQAASVIDVLINNAGVMALPTRQLSVDGYEMHFATNFLGHWLFTKLLSPTFLTGTRVVNVTSGAYMVCPIRFHDINWEGHALPNEEKPDMVQAQNLGIGSLTNGDDQYNPMLAYLHSNAACMLYSVGLSDGLLGRHVVAISAAPGVVLTELQRHIGGFRNATTQYKTASQGAASFLVAAFDPALQRHNGAYINDCQLTAIDCAHVQDKLVARKLWCLAEQMVSERV